MALHHYILCLCGLTLGCVLGAGAAVPDGHLTPIAAIKAMSKDEAAAAVAVRVKGVVIQYETESFVIHDGRDGLFVECRLGAVPPFGREVEVEGTTDSGGFAPVIRAVRIATLGEREVTPQVIAHLEDLENGSLDCQWVEVEGWLRSAQPPSPAVPAYTAYAVLSSGSARLNLTFLATTYTELQKWVGSRVRLRASCGHYFNPHGQLYGARLIVPRTADVDVLEPALPRAAVPLVRIDSLLRYAPTEPPQGRVHIRGTVTYQRDGSEIYVQQDLRGVYVRHTDHRQLAVGDVVDVVGYLRRGFFSPEIEDAETELLNRGTELVARPVSVEEAKIADGTLVRIDGVLLDFFPGAKTSVLTLKADGAPISAVLPLPAGAWDIPAAGSLMQLTGVVRALQAPAVGSPFPWTPSTIELRLRTVADLRVLQRPSLSLVVWVFGGVTVLTSVSLLVAGTLWWQSKARLREQKRERVIREAEFAAMIKERTRLAREIHDSLAQGFTAVSIQLEIAKHKLPAGAAGAQEHLEAARALVRESLAEARRSIQGLRSEALSNADFLAALTRSSTRILKDTAIAFHPELEGDMARLGAEAGNELLRIATEAMTNTVKHSRAKNIHVTCRVRDDYGEMRVSDDGVGFMTGADAATGFGLRGMQERARRLNGHFVITSEPGLGTHLITRIPLAGTPCNPPSSSSS
jgi:signal transduction histidine kinase